MDKSRKLDFVQGKNLGPIDDLREALTRLEETCLNIKEMDSEQSLALLHDLDRIDEIFNELDADDEDLLSERTRFESIQIRVKRKSKKLLKIIGGPDALQQQRPQSASNFDEAWWWYLDDLVAEQREKSLKRAGITGLVILVILGVLVLLFNTILKPSPEAVARLNAENDAFSAIGQGDFELALTAIDDGLTKVPNDAALLVVKGALLQLLDRDAQAEEVLSQVEAVIDDPLEYHLSLAQIYLRTGQVERSEAEAVTVLELDENNARGWMALGQAQEMQGNYLEAMKSFELASDLAYENEENEVYVIARMSLARLMESLPSLSFEDGTVEPGE